MLGGLGEGAVIGAEPGQEVCGGLDARPDVFRCIRGSAVSCCAPSGSRQYPPLGVRAQQLSILAGYGGQEVSQPRVQGTEVVGSGLDDPGVLENGPQVVGRTSRGEFIEQLMRRWALRRDELAEELYPLRVTNDSQCSIRCGVVGQISPNALQLRVDVSAGAGQQFGDARLDDARQAAGSLEQVHPSAVAARPAALVT